MHVAGKSRANDAVIASHTVAAGTVKRSFVQHGIRILKGRGIGLQRHLETHVLVHDAGGGIDHALLGLAGTDVGVQIVLHLFGIPDTVIGGDHL